MAKEKTIKAFMFTYSREGEEGTPLHSVVVVAYDAKEASKHFGAWLVLKHINILSLVIQTLRRSKKNARFYSQDFYNKQNMYLYDHEEYNRQYHGLNFKG